MANKEKIQNLIKALIEELGEDPTREGLRKTPERVAKSYEKLFGGYDRSLENELTVFKNNNKYDDIVYSGAINFFSTCEHHLLPFYGKAYVAYIPNEEIIGLSKLARAVDIFSRRMQDQERITVQVADEISRLVDTKGVAVMLEAQHFCNMARGVQQVESTMKTFAFRGCFKAEDGMKKRFIDMTRN